MDVFQAFNLHVESSSEMFKSPFYFFWLVTCLNHNVFINHRQNVSSFGETVEGSFGVMILAQEPRSFPWVRWDLYLPMLTDLSRCICSLPPLDVNRAQLVYFVRYICKACGISSLNHLKPTSASCIVIHCNSKKAQWLLFCFFYLFPPDIFSRFSYGSDFGHSTSHLHH